ncbi:hypothetical protein GQ473_04670 [archaeon]|nr:hypothetical protein [archaeon]
MVRAMEGINMKDRNGMELNINDFIVISANVSTASQALLFGLITKVTKKRISIIRESGWLYASTKPYLKTYMRNNDAIMKIRIDVVPEEIRNELIELNGD